MSILNLIGKGKPKFENDIEKKLYEENFAGYKDRKDNLDYQERLLKRVNEAQARYKKDGNLERVIKELEYSFVKAKPPCISSQNMDLAEYYIKAGRNDDAYRYLNQLYASQRAPVAKIRLMQAKILKKENRWADAIEIYMLGYLTKSEWNGSFQKEMFIKDVRPLVNKLGWNSDVTEELSNMVAKYVKKKNYNEGDLSKEYRKYYEKISIKKE